MKILITGGSGLLATNWAVAVRDEHVVMLGLHNRKISMRNVATLELELEAEVHASLSAIEPDLVIHTAGATSVEWCESFPEEARRINVNLTTNVACACSALKIPMVLISTDHLFVGDHAFVNESCPPAPKMCMVVPRLKLNCAPSRTTVLHWLYAQIFSAGVRVTDSHLVTGSYIRHGPAKQLDYSRTYILRRY